MSEKANVELMSGKSRPSKACSLCMISLALILCAVAGMASVWFPKYVHDLIVDAGTLCESDQSGKLEAYTDFLDPEDPITESFVFYSWSDTDAANFVTGAGDAKVSEKGPYVYKKFTKNYDMTFTEGEMTYKSINNWVYNSDESGEGLDPIEDMVLVENLGYQNLMVTVLSEAVAMFTVRGCTQAQITLIGDEELIPNMQAWSANPSAAPASGPLPCKNTVAPLKDVFDEASCACCIPHSTIPAESAGGSALVTTKQGFATYPDAIFCEDLLSYDGNPVVRFLSNLAHIDRGVLTNLAEYQGGTAAPIFTPALHKISVFELAFGYPSALVGHLLVQLTGAIDAEDIATVIGVGAYSDSFSGKCFQECDATTALQASASLADYKFRVAYLGQTNVEEEVKALEDTASAATLGTTRCSGKTDAYDSITSGLQYYQGEQSCAPVADGYMAANIICGHFADFYTAVLTNIGGGGDHSTFDSATVLTTNRDVIDCKCAAFAITTVESPQIVSEFLSQKVTSLGPVSTGGVSGNGEEYDVPRVLPCCLESGFTASVGSLRGFGCMAPVTGRIADTWMTDMVHAKYYADASGLKSESRTTGCKAGEEKNAWAQTKYAEETEYAVWMEPGNNEALPNPSEMQTFQGRFKAGLTAADSYGVGSPEIFKSQVSGGPGTQIPPEGIDTRKFGDAHLNDNVKVLDEFSLYETNSKLALVVVSAGASNVKEIPTQRYWIAEDGLHKDYSDNADRGIGPIDGFVALAYSKQVPIALSQPNFFNADASLLDGVEITSLDDVILTKESVDEKILDYQTYFDVELSTGKTFKAHQRLQVVTYVQGCNWLDSSTGSQTQLDCKLAFNYEIYSDLVATYGGDGNINSATTPSQQYLQAGALPTSIYNVITPRMKGDVKVPLYRIDRNAELKDDQADSFKELEKTLQLADIVSVIFALAGVLLGLCGIVRCMQG